MSTLKFFGWMRSGAASGGVVGPDPSRLEGRLELQLTDLDNNPKLDVPEPAPFLLMGPGDVRGLLPGAVTAMLPPPADAKAEATKLAQVELAEPDLPWRYSPKVAETVAPSLPNAKLQPWIVLVVGKPSEIAIEGNGKVTLASTVVEAHPLDRSARWAHVQISEGKTVARILSPRALEPNTSYIAVLVPAFKADGSRSWQTESVRLDAYHWWTFATGAAGDFSTIAQKLDRPQEAEKPALARLGLTPVAYDMRRQVEELDTRGALVRLGLNPADEPLPASMRTHLANLRKPLSDPRGRPIVEFPTYGAAWALPAATQATDWREELNGDPRHRGIGGLGLWAGIAMQELIADAAKKQAGALFIAAQRIRALTAGLKASGSLWERRLPSDPFQQLQIFGPSLARMTTATSLVVKLVADGVRPMPSALFSSAARRMLRPGTARARLVAAGALSPANIFTAANRCPGPNREIPDGLAHADAAGDRSTRAMDDFMRAFADAPPQEWGSFRETLQGGRRRIDDAIDQTVRMDREEQEREQQGLPLRPWRRVPDGDRNWAETTLEGGLDDLGALLPVATREPHRRCVLVQDLPGFIDKLARTIDPRSADAIVRRRVLGTISGLDPQQPLAPPELCPDFNLPAWRFLRDSARNWLLPGAGLLPKDRVIAVQTNRRFVDAFMVGLNTQALGELRWRNIPVRTDCTPLRRFWERVNLTTDQPSYDVDGVHKWAADTPLGDAQHATGEAAATNLVIVVHSELFTRYPDTLVYLMPRKGNAFTEAADWSNPSLRVFPTFPGTLGPDLNFFGFDVPPSILDTHWLVLEEIPKGYRFLHSVGVLLNESGLPEVKKAEIVLRKLRAESASDGGTFAAASMYDPVRVLLAGDSLKPQ